MDERTLIERLRRIAALHAGATTEGERQAAAAAMDRVKERLRRSERPDPSIACKFSLPDPWMRRLFLALCRQHGLDPYRRYGQHRQTLMVRVSRRYLDETLWPEFLELQSTLFAYLDETTGRVIREGVHRDVSEAREVAGLHGVPA